MGNARVPEDSVTPWLVVGAQIAATSVNPQLKASKGQI